MTSLPIMKKPLIPRMIGNKVAQCGIPSLSPCSFTPFRLNTSNQARNWCRAPKRRDGNCAKRCGTALFDFGEDNRIERMLRCGHAVRPKNYGSPFNHVIRSRLEPVAMNVCHCSRRATFLRTAVSQCVRGRSLEFPGIERRPSGRWGSAPACFRFLPQAPGLFDTHVLVGVVHHRIEPSASLCFREMSRGEPLLENLPKRLLLYRLIAIEESWASCL